MVSPETDLTKLSIKLEEVLVHYEVNRKTTQQLEKDMMENISMFLNARQIEGLSPLTLRSDFYELNDFAKFVNKACALVTTPDIRSYLASCDVMQSTVGTKLSKIKSFYKWLVEEEIVLRNPAAKIKTPKVPKRLPKHLTISELERVRESCDTLRQRALIETLYSTGCRISELIGLDQQQIDWNTSTVNVIGKGDKERTVYLSERAVYHLRAYLNSRTDDCEALFVAFNRPHRRLSKRSAADELEKIEAKAGFDKHLHPHLFRHTYGMLKMESGIELADLQQLLGHSNPSTTLTYGRVSEERKRRAYAKHHVQ